MLPRRHSRECSRFAGGQERGLSSCRIDLTASCPILPRAAPLPRPAPPRPHPPVVCPGFGFDRSLFPKIFSKSCSDSVQLCSPCASSRPGLWYVDVSELGTSKGFIETTCRIQNPNIPWAGRFGAPGGTARRGRAGLGAHRTVRQGITSPAYPPRDRRNVA